MNIKINLVAIPKNLFVDGVLVRDIIHAHIMSSEERANCTSKNCDIVANPLVGNPMNISRKVLHDYYTYINGKSIDVKGWQHKHGDYTVFRDLRTQGCSGVPVKVFKVPKNTEIEMNNTKVSENAPENVYIVCLTDDNGEIDLNTACVVDKKTFDKVGYILKSDTITRAVNKHKKNPARPFSFDGLNGITKTNTPATSVDEQGIRTLPEKREEAVKKARHDGFLEGLCTGAEIEENKKQRQHEQLDKQTSQTSQTRPFVAVAQIMNNSGRRIGFILMDKAGKRASISVETTLKLCNAGKVQNLVSVTNQFGNQFIRGNGCSIEDLKIVYKA